jgi:hypothetical protein
MTYKITKWDKDVFSFECESCNETSKQLFGNKVMTHEWKAGDRAMVEIARIDRGEILLKQGNHGCEYWVPQDLLKPLSTLDPHQALRDAIVEAAMKWQENHSAPFISDEPTATLYSSVLAFRAAMTPPDPVEAVIVAWRSRIDDDWDDRMERAIAALEYARGVK